MSTWHVFWFTLGGALLGLVVAGPRVGAYTGLAGFLLGIWSSWLFVA